MKSTVSPLEYHVLLALAAGPQYGYAIKEAVEVESGGTLSPPAGSLYRVIARFAEQGWVEETEPREVAPHPGRARRYYRLTADGHAVLAEEARRLREVAALAQRRLKAAEGRT